MADGMPQGLYDYLNNIEDHRSTATIVAWYPFTEPNHSTGFSPNVAIRGDSSVNSLSLNAFGTGGVVGGELQIPVGTTGYVKQEKTNSDLAIFGNLSILLWYRWGGDSGSPLPNRDDSYILLYRGDDALDQTSNSTYEIIIDETDGRIKLVYKERGLLRVEVPGVYDTPVYFPKDGNYHYIIVRRDEFSLGGADQRWWCVSVDGGAEQRYEYTREYDVAVGESSLSYLSVGGSTAAPRGFGAYKGIYIIDSKLALSDLRYIASFGFPEASWFDYSNWDSATNTGYVTWMAAGAPHQFKALRKRILNYVKISWDTAVYTDNYILQRDTDPEFSNPIQVYSGPEKVYVDTITVSGHYYYRVRSQITSLDIDSPWSDSHVYVTVTNWEWDFGDGSSISDIRIPSKTYTVGGIYSPSLRVYNDFYSDTYTRPDYIEVVNVVHEWDFGDGSPKSYEQNPVHVYTAPGTYDVTLRVTTYNDSSQITYSTYVTVSGSVLRYADFYGTPTRGEKRLTTTFVDTSYGDFTEWLWNFGDGIFSTERNPVHYYRRPGIYTVSLTARGVSGEYNKTRVNYIVVRSDLTIDIAPEPDKDMYLRGMGFVYKRNVGIEIKRVTGIS